MTPKLVHRLPFDPAPCEPALARPLRPRRLVRRIAQVLAWTICALIPAASVLISNPSVLASEISVAEIDRQITSGQLENAAEIARTIDDDDHADADPTLVLARLAWAMHQAGDIEAAAEFYRRSVQASARPAAKSLSPAKIILVRLAATSTLASCGHFADAMDAVAPTLAAHSEATETQQRLAAKLCLHIGSSAIAAADHSTAYQAYSLAAKHSTAEAKPTAMLGAAWSLALGGEQPVLAAQQLAAFIESYPQHPDASRAARACATCMMQAGRAEDAHAMLADLLHRWPTSEAALQVVLNQPTGPIDIDKVAPPVRQWLLSSSALQQIERLDLNIVRLGLLLSAEDDQAGVWLAYVRRLAELDESGQTTADLLQHLSDSDRAADAERLAALLIAPSEGLEIASSVREASCRWAGRTQRWSMLAFASESESPELDTKSRTVSVERLFAEALMQTGRAADAQVWWKRLVDQRGANDFATLLRCAETETSLGSDAELAASRIDAARAAAGDSPFRLSLVDLLDAELAIRRMKFDHARGLLESVVRSSETDANLRGRAQWLIGETHYLQQDYAAAIEAYRRVEGIDSNGMWVAASLIQAGKSFEQLGRTREAAVCYWGLVSRFAESPHARMAQRRLAAISPDQQSQSPNNSSNQILRR